MCEYKHGTYGFGNLLAYFKIVRKYANPLPDLAYANVFAQKSQPFAYSGYVPGRLPGRQGTAVLLFDIWSKYDNLAYSMTYFGCVDKFARHLYFLANLCKIC